MFVKMMWIISELIWCELSYIFWILYFCELEYSLVGWLLDNNDLKLNIFNKICWYYWLNDIEK